MPPLHGDPRRLACDGAVLHDGDADVGRALYEAASGLMTRFKGKDKTYHYSCVFISFLNHWATMI